MPRKKKVKPIKATYDLIMSAPSEDEQNKLAQMMLSYAQGYRQGLLAANGQKSAQSA